MDDLVELENIHLKMTGSNDKTSRWCVSGSYQYYHYKCDGYDDIGWGCGYRTIQTICSWLQGGQTTEKEVEIPSILDIQRILVDCGDKPASFHGSRDWIGCFEASIVIDTLYNVPCKIVHCEQGRGIQLDFIREHFSETKLGGPIMMGGDLDAASKGILGYSIDQCVLVADPHFSKSNREDKIDADYLLRNEWISWRSTNSFEPNSFYNACLPQKFINRK